MNIEYKIVLHEEYIPVKGNAMASGDDEFDKSVEDKIIKDYNAGNFWTWCCVEVIAYIDGIDLQGSDFLGACSYKDMQDFINGGYYEDMKERAKEELLAKIQVIKDLSVISDAVV